MADAVTNYAILILSNYGYSRSPREFREPCWGGNWRRKSFLTQALIYLRTRNVHWKEYVAKMGKTNAKPSLQNGGCRHELRDLDSK